MTDTPNGTVELVEIWKGWGENDAQFIQGLLESFGIASILRGESTRLTHGFAISKLAEVRVLVRKEDEEKAREMIAPPPE